MIDNRFLSRTNNHLDGVTSGCGVFLYKNKDLVSAIIKVVNVIIVILVLRTVSFDTSNVIKIYVYVWGAEMAERDDIIYDVYCIIWC